MIYSGDVSIALPGVIRRPGHLMLASGSATFYYIIAGPFLQVVRPVIHFFLYFRNWFYCYTNLREMMSIMPPEA